MANVALLSIRNLTNVRSAIPGFLQGVAAWSPALAARLAVAAFFMSPPRRRLSAIERDVLAKGRAFTVRAAGHTVRAWAWGNGRPVLLVHGWGGHGAQLHAFVEPLRAAGLMPVTFDAPGHGASTGYQAHIPMFAAALSAVADQVGAPHAIVAHSLGAPVAALAVARGLPVERLALIGGAAEPGRWLHAWLELVVGDPDGVAAGVEHATRFVGASPESLGVPSNAAEVKAAVLIVHDRRDREVPLADADAIAAAWPEARRVHTDGLGHRRILSDSDVVAQVTGFVAAGVRSELRDVELELMRPSSRRAS